MKKFFGKKSSSSAAGTPESDNPYAQASPANDPYANSNSPQSSRPNLAGGLPSGPRAGGAGLPRGPGPRRTTDDGAPPDYMSRQGSYASSTNPPSYSSNSEPSQSQGRFAPSRYGASGGYGSDRYDNNSAGDQKAGPQGGGGYGGFASRGDLFGSGSRRGGADAPQDNPYEDRTRRPADAEDGRVNPYENPAAAAAAGGYGARNDPTVGSQGGYGEERELTQEEKEEQEYQDTKSQIRAYRKQDNATLDNLDVLTDQMLERGGQTLEMLYSQGERLTNAEKNLDSANIHNRTAKSNIADLHRINGSMFSGIKPRMPGNKSRRYAAQEETASMQHEEDRRVREATRQEGFRIQQQREALNRPDGSNYLSSVPKPKKFNSKYQLEDDDEEDQEDEEAIDEKMGKLSMKMDRVHGLAVGMGSEVERQNRHLNTLGNKADLVDDGIASNRLKLNRIR